MLRVSLIKWFISQRLDTLNFCIQLGTGSPRAMSRKERDYTAYDRLCTADGVAASGSEMQGD